MWPISKQAVNLAACGSVRILAAFRAAMSMSSPEIQDNLAALQRRTVLRNQRPQSEEITRQHSMRYTIGRASVCCVSYCCRLSALSHRPFSVCRHVWLWLCERDGQGDNSALCLSHFSASFASCHDNEVDYDEVTQLQTP